MKDLWLFVFRPPRWNKLLPLLCRLPVGQKDVFAIYFLTS